jgi:phosphatidate cytidylyltransferase
MLNRFLVAAVLIPIVSILIIFGEFSSFLTLELFIYLMMWEFYSMVEKSGIKVNKVSGLILSTVLPAAYYFNFLNDRFTSISFFIAIATIFFIVKRVIDNNIRESMKTISYTFFGVVYISFLFSHLIAIKSLFSEKMVFLSLEMDKGRVWLFLTLIIALGSDAAAYFVGIYLGKRALSPNISPKKTVEGFLGSIFFGLIFSIYLYLNRDLELNIIQSLTVGFGGSVLGQLGDLGASIFKREFNVKDSGKIFMSHGGVFDRCDSLLFVAPFIFYFLKFMV